MAGATLEKIAELQQPFKPEQVRWRIGHMGKAGNDGERKGMALAYVDARDVMRRLDSVVGPANWSDRYTHHLDGGGKTIVYCELSVRVAGGSFAAEEAEWVTKGDGSAASDIESEKGAISGAFKRAAVKWGIGRYLYEIDSPWVITQKRGKGDVIAPKEHARLAELLRTGKMMVPEIAKPQTHEERIALMLEWCAARDVTKEMIFGLLEKAHDDPLTEQDLATIRAQAVLVNAGTHTPEEAFGESAKQRADAVDAKLNGEKF